jgi:CDP-4-dehydro-6-deoxyglucose reductase
MEFNVLNHYTGRYFTVTEHEIILDAALRQGEALPYSCRNGYCGTCKAKLINGQIKSISDNFLLAKETRERGELLLCQSKAISDIEIYAPVFNRLSKANNRRHPSGIVGISSPRNRNFKR